MNGNNLCLRVSCCHSSESVGACGASFFPHTLRITIPSSQPSQQSRPTSATVYQSLNLMQKTSNLKSLPQFTTQCSRSHLKMYMGGSVGVVMDKKTVYLYIHTPMLTSYFAFPLPFICLTFAKTLLLIARAVPSLIPGMISIMCSGVRDSSTSSSRW